MWLGLVLPHSPDTIQTEGVLERVDEARILLLMVRCLRARVHRLLPAHHAHTGAPECGSRLNIFRGQGWGGAVLSSWPCLLLWFWSGEVLPALCASNRGFCCCDHGHMMESRMRLLMCVHIFTTVLAVQSTTRTWCTRMSSSQRTSPVWNGGRHRVVYQITLTPMLFA